MCFNKETSIGAWLISLVLAFYLYIRNKNYDRWNAGFIVTFTTIQLLEAGIWFSLETHNSNLGNIFTKCVLVVLLLQPLVQTYLGYEFTHAYILYVMSFVYLGLVVWAIYKVTTITAHSEIGVNGHLVWSVSKYMNGIVGVLYIAGLFLPLFFMDNYKGIPLVVVGVITALYSLIKTNMKEFSSYWCFTAVIYGVVALF